MALATDSPWAEIVSAALIGTERQPFQPPLAPGQLGQVLTQINMQSTEATLLLVAAITALHQRVGWVPETRATALTEPCSLDALPRCSPRAARCLQQILQGQYPQLLLEWLELAAIAQQRVPELYLPVLLDKGRQQRELRRAILAVLGQRGRWLARQQPDWSYAVPLTSATDWDTGASTARLSALQELRAHDPDQARVLLQSSWSQEGASDRAKFLATLQTQLTLTDEPLLAQALGDRSKEVRRVAADFLARLPNSQLCQQLAQHTCRYLSLERVPNLALRVQLPEQLDDALKQLGIEKTATTVVNTKLGEKAWWLLQMIGATPLPTWTSQWQLSPQEIVHLTLSHEWQMALLNGFALAAKRQKNNEWLEIIFHVYFTGQASVRDAALVEISLEDLFKSLSSDRQDVLLISLIQSSSRTISDSLIIWLLRHSAQIWSVDLSHLVLGSLEKHWVDTKVFSNSDWELRTALKDFARFIPVTFTVEIEELISRLTFDYSWQQSIDEFLAILQFRREMNQGFFIGDKN